ncbi:MAG: polyprenyl synthetase family protein [Acidobacteriota bacterium]|nr:polyprenyl synthetase family protein [Acidobacteriota bacterium]
MTDLKLFFSQCTRTIDEKLERLVPSLQTEPTKLHEAVRWSLFAGGKRFRPALVFAVGKTFGARQEKLLCAAAAIEMIHTYSLVHDDLPAMDDDDLRRGRATCHKKFDQATAILTGDVLQTLAFQAIAEDEKLSAKIRVKLVSELARAAGTPTGMVAGQQLDLDGEGRSFSIEDLEKIHHGKTGAIICASARAGAIIAEADEKELEAVSNYAARLGLLFQITDDLLDVTQTTEILGKTAGKDEQAKKATYPSFYGIEGTRKLAENVCAQAVNSLKKIEKDTSLLNDLANFILNRRK